MGSGADSINDTTEQDWNALRWPKTATGEHYKKVNDMVNSPAHYTQHKWEVIDVLEEYFSAEPLLWQVGKYLLRCKYKGHELQDLEKAAWYLNRKINKLKEKQNG